jgi:uncharacterized protein (TIGR00255 family)
VIHSMTGYGYSESAEKQLSVSVEIKGYNNRYLDVQLTMPATLGALENDLRNLIKERCVRGRVEVYIRLQSSDEELKVRTDTAQARALAEGLREVRRAAGIRGALRLEHLLKFDGLIRLEKSRDAEAAKAVLTEQFRIALEAFAASRLTEGESTVRDILAQLERFESAFHGVRSREKEIEEHINRQLRSRFEEVMGDKIEEDRILAELASLLVKHSINEEISRLDAHIGQFKAELAAGGALGKRLDFLCQEMNRETNTIGSKNLLKDIAVGVIDMKDALENIREQLRNIE